MRLLAAVGLAVAGAATGIATVALYSLLWGLLLSAAATLATLLALPGGWWSRLAFVAGWDGVVGWLTVPRAEGDYLVTQTLSGYAVLALGLVVLVFAIGTLPRPSRPRL